MMSQETPFKISVSDDKIRALMQKLESTVFPDELEGAGFRYGAPLADITRLATRWKSGFDWRAQEEALNSELPQFTRPIDVEGHGTLDIHYVHKKSEITGAIPLLFVHGWPGSFVEIRKLLPLLVAASPEHPSFHVVAIGLPGFGFSQASSKPGFKLAQYAEVGHKLMLALGYEAYVTQGGDWGNHITRKIAIDYGGKYVKAWHSNHPTGLEPSLISHPVSYLKHLLTPYSAEEKALLDRNAWFFKVGRGYNEEQRTFPQTLGYYSLADSPVGLLAWVYEKLVTWTDNYPWEDDEILTWISIYYFSRAGPAASVRIYYEADPDISSSIHLKPAIPFGVSIFPKDLIGQPHVYYGVNGNLVFLKHHQSGGHFAAHETPDLLVDDLRMMFGKGGPAFGVVPSKAGY